VKALEQRGGVAYPVNVDAPFVAYETRFTMPLASSMSRLWYSFEVAGAHLVMLNAYSPYDSKSEQVGAAGGEVLAVGWLLCRVVAV
jgi:hypothetical protein